MHLHLHTQQPDSMTQSVSQSDQHGMIENYKTYQILSITATTSPSLFYKTAHSYTTTQDQASPSKNKNIQTNIQATILRKPNPKKVN